MELGNRQVISEDDRRWARRWLMDAALPLWWRIGADHQSGGWFDRIDQDGRATSSPKRARVQARQVFVYACAGRLGWSGPWRDAVRHGLNYLRGAFRRRDGLYRKSVTVAGIPLNDEYDLYDQAFVLLALASGYGALGRPAELIDEARRLLGALETQLSHPLVGFEEGSPRVLPLRSNPHMHLLEALLAWVEVDGSTAFRTHAAGIAALATDRLIDPATGAIGEYYDSNWNFATDQQGAIREPGHQFEWAWLLTEADRLLGGDHTAAISRLEAFSDRFGIDRTRRVAVLSLDARGEMTDAGARIWAQTERLRTAVVLARHSSTTDEVARLELAAADSLAALRRFLDTPVPGLWRDCMSADGGLIDEAAPASSFYHIMTGLLPLLGISAFVPLND